MELKKYSNSAHVNRNQKNMPSSSLPILDLKSDDPLTIDPLKIEFKDAVVKNEYAMQILIRNKTQQIAKFKIYNPKLNVFHIHHDHSLVSLSPGLSKKFKITFSCLQNNDYYDQFKIICQSKSIQNIDKSYLIPLKATRAFFSVNYSTLIQGGIVALNVKHRFSTSITNTGPRSKIRIFKENQEAINISPDEFFIENGHQQQISMIVVPNTIGTYRHKLLVQVNDHMSEPINLIYSSTQFKFFLTTEQGKILTELDIGYCFYGQQKSTKVIAVNNTPDKVSLKSKIRLGWKFNESALQSPHELGIECSSTIIEVVPPIVEIKPFSKFPLTLVCEHEVNHEISSKIVNFARRQENIKKLNQNIITQIQALKMSDNQFHQTLIAQFGQKKIYCSLKVTCGYPLIKIQPVCLLYGEIKFKKTEMKKLTIRNMKQNLAVKICFPKTFSFEIIPNSALIEPNSQRQFEVFLTPVSFGDFNTNVPFLLCNLFKIQIPVSYNVPLQQKRQSASAHHYSLSEEKQVHELVDNHKKKHNFLNNTINNYSLAQNKIKVRTKFGGRNFLHHLTCKQNMLESASDLFASQKVPNYQQSQAEDELVPGENLCKLPTKKDTLFVTRKIDRYEPYKNLNTKYKMQTREIVNQFRKIPKNKKQHMQICKQLPVEALKHVNVTEKIINFGKVFVHSKMIKQFQIINNNDFSIQVKLTPSHQFLCDTDSQPQVMPGKTKSKFKVILYPKTCGEFESLIDYTINSVHHFRFLVQAQIQLVTLSVSKFNLKLNYQDDAKDMLLTDSFDLTNEGNTQAQFTIEQNLQQLLIEPKFGILTSGQSITISVLHNLTNCQTIPAGQPKNIKQYNKPTMLNIDQRIIVKVKNGVDMFLRVQSNILQPKCYIKQSKINFGCCIVPKSKSKPFVIKNLGRSVCLYEIDGSGTENFLHFDSLKGKVLPESSKQIIVTYKSNTIHQVNMSFKVIIRGGLIINVPFHAQSIAPKISVLENNFNFGQVSCGSTSILPITIKNDSETTVELLLDLLNKLSRGAEYLDISFENLEKEGKSMMQKSSHHQIVHKIKVEGKSTLKFLLLFQPSLPGFYQFQLPIYIENFIKNETISKIVTCYAKQPKFFLQPSIIKFKKKIINDKDNACFHPLVQFITLKNPSEMVLKWKIQLPKAQNGKKLCFEVQNRKGEVKAKSWQCINIAFNPYQQGIYSYKFPVFIYNWDKADYVQQAEIKVQGQGQYPILLFDRKQLILPVVPLQIQSVGMFKIINEGYQTIDIKHRIYSLDELLLIPDIILFYPDGSKMGINKKELYVIVKFVSKKPVSFTVKLEIYDGCRIYELPISGTSDNSLFTNFPYLSDKENLYKIQSMNQTINLRSIDTRNIIDKIHNHYDQVGETDYNLPCEIIRRWINTILKDDKVMRFPEDIINSNQTLLRFLFKITNKKQLEKPSSELDTQEKFYEWVIRILKSMGCLLNHIRPYFLLGKDNFQAIFQDSSLKHMSQNYKKYYKVIHLESWIILFYQVISNFWYNPQKIKTNDLKSNIYSNNQIQVLKWIRQIFLQYNEGDDHKFIDLNKDFRDCFAPIYALYHYNFMNKNQSLQGLNKHTVSNSDCTGNIRMLYSMLSKANLIPLISEDEYQNIREKEMFLLLYQLFQSLPQQLPKTAPIIFTCQLGERCLKYIQIKNPSNKFVNYWIRIQGSNDYSTKDQQCIRIEPKGSYRLGVQFKSRVSQQQVAFLILFNKKQIDNNSGVGCSLVFELKSLIVGRKSIKKLENLKCPMYENASIKIPVQNMFNDKQYGNFKIILSQELIQTKQSPRIFNFSIEVDSIKIRRNTSGFIELFYSPMVLKTVRCFIIFCDPAVGQFQYQIAGIPEVPKPLQQIKVQNPVYLNTQESIQLSLPVYNNFMIKSLSLMEQKWETLKNINRTNNKQMQLVPNFSEEEKEELTFKVEVNMDPKILQFIKFPQQITIFHRKKTKADIRNKLKIECNFNVIIKDLVLDFVLLSIDKRDVRRFKAQINVTSQPIISNLLMKTNARTPLVQQIPFENTSNKDWKINCQIIDMESNQFSLKQAQPCLQKDYICKKNCFVNSYFVYHPEWISESSCKLKITNLITNEQIIYNIKGISEQPLSDDHIYFSTFTGKSNLHSIQIKNPYSEKLTYHIITDLVEIQCSPEITLQADEKISFNLIISVNSPGIFIGFIKFVDTLGRYFWYSVTIQAEDQVIYEEKIKFQSLLDEQIQKVLQFKNSLSKTSAYKVDFDSQYLTGEKLFQIKPYSSYLYRLKFRPAQVINEETTIRIFCPQKGAHIYKVQMISHEHYKRQLVPLKVEVGRTGFREVKLTEVSQNKQNFVYSISNSNFYIEYGQPDNNGEVTMRICYKPVSEGSQKCVIKVVYGFNKTKVYEIQGIGIAPFTVQTVQFESIDLKPALQIIKFKNPYQKNSNIEIGEQVFSCYIERNDLNCFKFVGYGERWETKINDVLAIPIEFNPKQQGYFESMLSVQTDQYKWQYLLKGSCINEQNKNFFDEEIKCKTREQCIKVLVMEVPEFLKQQNLKPNRIEVYHQDPKTLAEIKSWLKLKIQMNEKQESKSTIYLRFRPRKPLKELVTFSLFSTVQESVKLNKKIRLISEAPEPQETISLEITSIKTHIYSIPIKIEDFDLSEAEVKMEKSEYFESQLISNENRVELKFSPNNCTFKNNIYSDLMIIEDDDQFRSFKIEVKLKNKAPVQKKKNQAK